MNIQNIAVTVDSIEDASDLEEMLASWGVPAKTSGNLVIITPNYKRQSGLLDWLATIHTCLQLFIVKESDDANFATISDRLI